MTAKEHYKVLIIGGAAGISVAARLNAGFSKDEIAVIEPSDKHFYQPFWTLVGSAGLFQKSNPCAKKRILFPITPAGSKTRQPNSSRTKIQ